MTTVDRRSRRNDLLDAALRVIREQGPGASMERLAAEAGVTKPILYRHFGDRDGLVAALGMRFARELVDEIASSLDAGGDPQTLLRRTLEAYLAFVARDPDVYRFIVDRVVREQPGAAVIAGSFLAEITDRVAAAVRRQADVLGVDDVDADGIAHGLVGMVHGVGLWWSSQPGIPLDRIVEDLVDVTWLGLAGLIESRSGGRR